MKRIQRYTARNHRRFPTNATNIRVGVAATASTPQVYTTTTTASVSSAASTSRGAASVESLFAVAANPAPSLPIASRRALTASTSSAPAAAARRRLPPATLLPAVVALYHSPFASRSHLESLSADGHLWSVLRLRAQLQGDSLARQAHLLRLVAVNAQSSGASRARQSDAMAGLLPSVVQRGREVARHTNDFVSAVVATFLCLFLF
jgi:hypothetical protein